MNRLAFLGLCLVSLTSRPISAEDKPAPSSRPLRAPAADSVEFQRDIRPIFANRCVTCHGPNKQKGGLRLDDPITALKGGNSGAVIVPRDSAKSRLLMVVAGLDSELKMPPQGQSLSARQVGLIRAWIDQGAKWPKEPAQTAGAVKNSHWAFAPPRRPE